MALSRKRKPPTGIGGQAGVGVAGVGGWRPVVTKPAKVKPKPARVGGSLSVSTSAKAPKVTPYSPKPAATVAQPALSMGGGGSAVGASSPVASLLPSTTTTTAGGSTGGTQTQQLIQQVLMNALNAGRTGGADPWKQAAKLVNQIIAAQNTQANTLYSQQVKNAQEQAAQVNAIYQGAAQAIKDLGLDTSAQQSYQGAANQANTYAQGFSKDMQANVAAATAKANADLASVGSPTQLGSENAQAAGNVLVGLGGYIPGQTFQQQGLAAAAQYRGLPSNTIATGANQSSAFLTKAQRDSQDWLQTQLASIAAQRPGLVANLASSVRGMQAQDQAAALNAPLSIANAVAQLKAAGIELPAGFGGASLAQQQQQTAQQNAITSWTNAQTTALRAAGYAVNPTTGKLTAAAGYKIDPRTGSPVKASAGGQVTQQQLSRLVDSFYNGKPGTQRIPVVNPDTGEQVVDKNGVPKYVTVSTTSAQLGYQQALRRLTGLKVDQQTAQQLLDTVYRRGERGRPWLSSVERMVLGKAKVAQTAFYEKYKGQWIAYLKPKQVAALAAAGLNVQTTPQNGKFYITQGY